MIIRQMQPKDCFAAKALWREVFGDSEAFANFYFAHRYTPTLSFGAFDGGQLVSMSLGRRVRPTAPACDTVLISGVSTLPAYRHRGLMRETMRRLLKNAAARGYALAILSPAIPHLYASLGFAPLTYAIEAREAARPANVFENAKPEQLLAIYAAVADTHPFMLRRDAADMRLLLKETSADGGTALLAGNGRGYLCYAPKGEEIEVIECIALDAETYRTLLQAAASRAPSQSATALLPADCGLDGVLCRPVHALALQGAVLQKELAPNRSAFCAQLY